MYAEIENRQMIFNTHNQKQSLNARGYRLELTIDRHDPDDNLYLYLNLNVFNSHADDGVR